ncbi:hypothetical protein PUN28_006557 [Cardiocondyla obscurior]|uniref:Uncharacterized protein n=1 Tax=Cardiocondyla obscurior TaxID=286306 RepID=A0AAW2G984_9HYME
MNQIARRIKKSLDGRASICDVIFRWFTRTAFSRAGRVTSERNWRRWKKTEDTDRKGIKDGREKERKKERERESAT